MSENDLKLEKDLKELSANVLRIKKHGMLKCYGLIFIAGMALGLASEIKYKIGYSEGVLKSMIELVDAIHEVERR